MAGKRRATTELNRDQLDLDDELEEREDPGVFQRASDESLKKRVIKTARRRNPISSVNDGEDTASKSAFTGLNMFAKAPPSSSNAFSFLSNLNTSNSQPKVNGIHKQDNIKSSDNVTVSTNSIVNNTNSAEKKFSNDYYSKLKGLNESVANWIKKHVDNNPLINLKPIFTDYERYFNQLESEKNVISNTGNSVEGDKGKASTSMEGFKFKSSENIPDISTEKNSTSKVTPKFSFNSVAVSKSVQSSATSIPKNSLLFPFGSSTTTTSTTSKSFTFGSNNTFETVSAASGPAISSMTFGVANPVTTTSGTSAFAIGSKNTSDSAQKSTASTFSFGAATSFSNVPSFSSTPAFSFANVAKPTPSDAHKNEGDDDYEPPKNEFTPVTETDHIYTIRCKVFVKKDEKFGDRGVGNLYLKPIENREQVQLIVRADTSLGNLLCNLILSKNIPTKRLGNKDVMLVCLPTPDSKPPPVPVLLRVKSGEEADQLFEVLEKHKK